MRFKPGGAALACTAALVLAGCSKQQIADKPHVTAAASKSAQADLRDVKEQWALAGAYGRRVLRPDLEAFLERYPQDPSADAVRIMLAQIALSERRYGSARELLAPVLAGPRGSARDEAQVVQAALLSREGKPEQALELLAPLEGKLLSAAARDQYYRERIRAALAVRRWRLAVDSMGAWLAEEGTSSQEVRTWVHDSMVQVPPRALSRLLSDWKTPQADKAETDAYEWLHRDIIEYLAAEAIAKQDPRLARDLLASSPPWLRASEHGDALVVLAALAQKEARISGRSLGVVVGGTSELLRRRNIRVAAGVLYGLKERKLLDQLQFYSAEDRGSVAAALGTLSGLGSTILVAGVDSATADEALAFAKNRSVPTLVLAEPSRGDWESPFGFSLGVSDAAQKEALKTHLQETAGIALIGTAELPCDAVDSGLPWQLWSDEGVHGVLVLGDARCARRVFAQRPAAADIWMGVGLIGASGPFSSAMQPWLLRSGRYPQSTEVFEDRASATADTDSAEIAPTWDWFFTLGYDAVQLIVPALSELPEDVVTEQTEVRSRHESAAAALAKIQADLRSSSARSFNAQHRLPRVLEVARLDSPDRKQP